MALYLLDSDAVIDYLNRFPSTLSLLVDLTDGGDTLCVCDVALAEVYAGLYPEYEPVAADFLPSLRFLSTSSEAAEQAGRWRFRYARRGRNVPLTDALIAATALHHAATIVTGNVRDYPMPGVSVLPLPR